MTGCTIAVIVSVLGYQPAPGETVLVPRSLVNQHTRIERAKAKLCARLHGIKWKIDESK